MGIWIGWTIEILIGTLRLALNREMFRLVLMILTASLGGFFDDMMDESPLFLPLRALCYIRCQWAWFRPFVVCSI